MRSFPQELANKREEFYLETLIFFNFSKVLIYEEIRVFSKKHRDIQYVKHLTLLQLKG